jgi:hypothetical protein
LGRGRVAFIFWNRVGKMANNHLVDYHISVGKILGMAISHELGHLLLPSGHSDPGLMKSEWGIRDFIMARRDALLLSPEQGDASASGSGQRGRRTTLDRATA